MSFCFILSVSAPSHGASLLPSSSVHFAVFHCGLIHSLDSELSRMLAFHLCMFIFRPLTGSFHFNCIFGALLILSQITLHCMSTRTRRSASDSQRMCLLKFAPRLLRRFFPLSLRVCILALVS
ncbi:hypothetical protein C8R43DRAFT_522928 [Mycena crocata]|nr:hypothetical protein C8R43DRAFT_522928 [Mycena crocata]